MFKVETERLNIIPFTEEYLNDYYKESTDNITRFQFPDSFTSIEQAKKRYENLVLDMREGKTLATIITSKDNEFIGKFDVYGLQEKSPELGLWLKEAAHGKGYGTEVMKAMLQYLNSTKKYSSYIYEADERNTASINLVKKFNGCEEGFIELKTDSGKELFLKQFIIYANEE